MSGLLRLGALAALCGGAVQSIGVAPAAAQVDQWRLGTAGGAWTAEVLEQVGAAFVGGALQPVQILPGANLTQLLTTSGQQWQNGPPEDYTLGGLPRAWSNATVFNLTKGPLLLVDGKSDTSSSTRGMFKTSGNPAGSAFFLDLGTSYPVNRIRFYPPDQDQDAYVRAYEVKTSSGADFDASDRPVYKLLRRVESNRDVVVDLEFETGMVRFIQIKNLSKTPFSLAEIEVYGKGFVPRTTYLTKLRKLSVPSNFGTVTVSATRLGSDLRAGLEPPRCTLRLRTGADATPVGYYRRNRETGEEEEVTQNEYEKLLPRLAYYRVDPVTGALTEVASRTDYMALPVDQQGPVRDFVQGSIRSDAANWSPWSVPIAFDSTGSVTVDLGLMGPRDYVQLWVQFAGDADNAMRVDALALQYTPLLATGAVGEVALASTPVPVTSVTEVESGIDTAFTCDVRATFAQTGLSGFDGVRIASFPAPEFVRLELGDPPAPAEAVSVTARDDGFDVRFAPINGAANVPVRVVYRQPILEHNTTVAVWLLGAGGSMPQPVAPGNARDEVGTNLLLVHSADPRPGLQFQLQPAVVTPNGDGANDELMVQYRLVQFADQVEVKVDILDLTGRVLRRVVDERQSSGEYTVVWDGRTGAGDLVVPGSYICRVRVDAQARDFTTARVLGVAY